MDFFQNARFVIQCDRRNGSDFIHTAGVVTLCDLNFPSPELKAKYGYKNTYGMMTDVQTLKKRGLKVACCNMSCGYYNPHTSQEVTKISDLEKCWTFVQHILSLDKTYTHDYAPKVYKPETYPVLKAPIRVPTLKFQNFYAKKLCKDNPNLTSAKMVELWLNNYQKIPLIPLTKFKDIHNATHNQLLSK